METWKDIEGYAGLYQISNFGQVKSFVKKEKILKQNTCPKGYKSVNLYLNGVSQTTRIHRLVGQYFLASSVKPQINHKNGVKSDNYYKNLEWATNLENQHHAWKNSLMTIQNCKGKNNNNYKTGLYCKT